MRPVCVQMSDEFADSAVARPSKRVKRSQRHRAFVFTLNFPEGADEDLCHAHAGHLDTQFKNDKRIKSFRYQLERGAGTGRLHLQGCMYFFEPATFELVRKAFIDPEVTKPWIKESVDYLGAWQYCGKDSTRVGGQVYEFGPAPVGKGTRTDLLDFKEDCELLKSGQKKVDAMFDEHFRIEAKYMKYFDRSLQRSMPRRSRKTWVCYVYGPPGTGKTRWATDLCRAVYGVAPFRLSLPDPKSHQPVWFDGLLSPPHYGKCVITDEYVRDALRVQLFNELADETEGVLVPVKGGFLPWAVEAWFITSNFSPIEAFPSRIAGECDTSVLRRLDWVVRFDYGSVHPNAAFDNAAACAENAVHFFEKQSNAH